MESWKVNLISVWFGCFFTGLAISQILPFLPLYVAELGVQSHEALSLWSGLTFSVTFLVSAFVSPLWGSLADRKGRKLMLLRAFAWHGSGYPVAGVRDQRLAALRAARADGAHLRVYP